eukprot:1110117-Prorocentrum_minimum.AAC.1
MTRPYVSRGTIHERVSPPDASEVPQRSVECWVSPKVILGQRLAGRPGGRRRTSKLREQNSR